MTSTLRRTPHICECGEHCFVATARGFVVFADTSDYDFIASRKWTCAQTARSDHTSYLNVSASVDGKPQRIGRLLLGAPPSRFVDHIDGNPLNNRRANLRLASASENNRNRKQKNRTGLKGVQVCKRRKGPDRYGAHIWIAGRGRYLGTFDSATEAALAYDRAAREYGGEFARLNYPDAPLPPAPGDRGC